MQGGGSKFRAGATGNLRKTLEAYKTQAIVQYDMYRERLIRALNEQILARTPVWEGDTIVNWRWSAGQPTGEFVEAIDNGPPGRTGKPTPLGSEPRRGPNEAYARSTLEATLREVRGKFVDIWLENNSEGAVPLEFGQWPTPDRSRTPPGGIVRVAVRNIVAGFLS